MHATALECARALGVIPRPELKIPTLRTFNLEKNDFEGNQLPGS